MKNRHVVIAVSAIFVFVQMSAVFCDAAGGAKVADSKSYLAEIKGLLGRTWPANRTVNIVCHGHSVPAGYFKTPKVDTFNAYPHLLHRGLKHRFPFSVTNVIVTAIGGETSETGTARFDADVLCHRPDVVTIDYALNDRGVGLAQARISWRTMIDKATGTVNTGRSVPDHVAARRVSRSDSDCSSSPPPS